MTREMGKVLAEARGDVQEGIDIAYLMAGEGRRMFGDTVPSELPDKWAMSIRQPIGIAGIITPWNFPIAIPCWKMMPALVAGNTVVFKPASDTPHCATLVVELMAEAGFPAGVVNLVTGSGSDVGDAIVESPDVPVISFTGHSSTGKSIAERAARRLKRVSLELGGKNAVVVLRDADLDLATDGILWSAFGTTGQRCTACSRVIVEKPVVEPLLEKLEARAKKLRLGSGLDESTDVGPLINPAAVEKVGSYIDVGKSEGELVLGGSPATDGDLVHGNFFWPTIFAGVGPMDRIAQEEIFGPVLSVIPVDDYQSGRDRAQPDPLRAVVRDLHARRERGLPGDARLRDRHRLRQRRHDRRRDAPPVRRLEGDRQRPPRGRPRRPRLVHRVEVDLRRLQRPPPARPDRQPAGLIVARCAVIGMVLAVLLTACSALLPEPTPNPCWGKRVVEEGTLTGVLRPSPNDPHLASLWLVREDGRGFEIGLPDGLTTETGPAPQRHHKLLVQRGKEITVFAEEGDTITITGAWYPDGKWFFACALVGPDDAWPP